MGVRDQVADDFVVHGIGVSAARLRQPADKKPSGNLAHGQMHSALEHGVERIAETWQRRPMRSRVVDIDLGRLLGLRDR